MSLLKVTVVAKVLALRAPIAIGHAIFIAVGPDPSLQRIERGSTESSIPYLTNHVLKGWFNGVCSQSLCYYLSFIAIESWVLHGPRELASVCHWETGGGNTSRLLPPRSGAIHTHRRASHYQTRFTVGGY
jgi:hypothetical protein